jgi:hypothetical protein
MSSYISAELRQRVSAYFRECCAYCRTPAALTIAIYEIEHIAPRVHEGKSTFANLCFACPTCNRYKGTRQSMNDAVTGKSIALFHPHQQRWQDHFRWSEDATILIGRTDTGRVTADALHMNRPELVRLRRLWVRLGEFPPLFEVQGS